MRFLLRVAARERVRELDAAARDIGMRRLRLAVVEETGRIIDYHNARVYQVEASGDVVPIAFEGRETSRLPSNRIARLGIAYCPEERGIFASLNVEENLLLPPMVPFCTPRLNWKVPLNCTSHGSVYDPPPFTCVRNGVS